MARQTRARELASDRVDASVREHRYRASLSHHPQSARVRLTCTARQGLVCYRDAGLPGLALRFSRRALEGRWSVWRLTGRGCAVHRSRESACLCAGRWSDGTRCHGWSTNSMRRAETADVRGRDWESVPQVRGMTSQPGGRVQGWRRDHAGGRSGGKLTAFMPESIGYIRPGQRLAAKQRALHLAVVLNARAMDEGNVRRAQQIITSSVRRCSGAVLRTVAAVVAVKAEGRNISRRSCSPRLQAHLISGWGSTCRCHTLAIGCLKPLFDACTANPCRAPRG